MSVKEKPDKQVKKEEKLSPQEIRKLTDTNKPVYDHAKGRIKQKS
ncbi:hypothetical protein RRU94_15610 [Domibacillus sp. DTU_2020_1001157_1_SI_ALB_TIR_016]|nr:hypothetical protein [Domibacillus sp. DTU_2020_1001157_1_SI_ALB_TIR_016]WNS82176.1 hypothetical protein RRU94_15610 [Domibacillus sp. DTU_2020_1001157_1_SI_ALB_TIR_016]